MARGLNIATNYFNRIEAVKDFNKVAAKLVAIGKRDFVMANLPPEKAGWKTIDKHTAILKENLRECTEKGKAV